MKTRAIRIHEHGGPEVLQLDEVEVPSPGPGEALVRNTAVGLNYIDTYQRSGLYALASLPAVLGQEAAGVVEAIGDGVTEVVVGQRVAYGGGPIGAYAERRVIAAQRLVPLPEGIDDVTAAAAMLKGMTVEYLVRRTYPVRRGETVLWHAAAGGVGLIAVQWLKHLGATVIGTVSSDEKAELARAHGCDHTIVYTREDFVARVREITNGAKVPVVYDSVGKATFPASLDCLAPRGYFVGFGNASGKPDPFDMLVLSAKGSLYLTRPTLATYTARREDLLESARALFDVILSGAVKIEVRQRFALADAKEAHRTLESRGTVGSTVLVP
jgi:NADPH2:quinone reductase